MDQKRNDSTLPFKVGQLAEARSFIKGFRGAWFRCKVEDIARKAGRTVYALQYYDFPGEKTKWTRVYQLPSKGNNASGGKRELMIRPHYPRIYAQKDVPSVDDISEIIVLTDCVWKIGDLVDWFTDGCFWSGSVTEIVNDDMVKVELPPPPLGEGSSYEVLRKDLRPSLDWSPRLGWRIPASEGSGKGPVSVRLVEPGDQATSFVHSNFPEHSKEEDDGKQSASKSKEDTQAPVRSMSLDGGCSGIGKSISSCTLSSTHVKEASADVQGVVSGREQDSDNRSPKKLHTDETVPMNYMNSDTVESAIMDIEELVSRVKWLKQMLECGIPLPDSASPSWKFLEHLIPTPK